MKKKSLSVLIALSLAVTTALPAASVFADTTTPVVTTAPASTYGVEYEAHVQSIGWQSPVTVTGDQTDVTNVTEAGTTGQSKRIEALKITGTNLPAGASITYQTHVQSIGWQSAVTETGNVAVDSAAQAGTTGQSKRVEAVKITLAGLPGYAVKYQAHVQSIGWQAPVTVNNGTDISDATIAGTTGQSKRVEAIKIEIVKTDAEKQAEVAAINAVAQAQASQAQADITAATTAVQAVQDTTENAALTAQLAAITPALAVSSVSAINDKAIQIKFTQPVLASTVITGGTVDSSNVTTGTLNNSNITIVGMTGAQTVTAATAAASLSADGKTLTITPSGTEYFGGNYAVTVTSSVTDTSTSANAIVPYSGIVNDVDTVRPTISAPTYTVNGIANFAFSEPVNATAAQIAAAMTVTKVSDGSTVAVAAGDITPATDGTSFTFNMHNLTADTAYTVTFVGLEDYAGNLINPNPVLYTITNSKVDTTAPTVVSVVPTSLTTMKVTFSEPLTAAAGVIGDYSIDGAAPVAIDTASGTGNTTLDSTNTVATVTVPAVTAGIHSIAISNFTDLSGNAGTTTAKSVSFAADTAPTYVSSQTVTIGSDEYLIVNYNKDVTVNAASNALTGTYVGSNSVTNSFANVLGTDASLYNPDSNGLSQSIKIKVTSLASGTYSAVIPSTLVQDVAGTGAAAQNVSFALGTIADATTVPVPTVADVQSANINQVEVTFNTDVTAATALNVANYTVEGQNVFSNAIFKGNDKTVILTLNPNAINLSGNRLFAIANITSVGGKVMNAFSADEPFVANLAPTIKTASLTAPNIITLTLSKSVNAVAGNFVVNVNGTPTTATVTVGGSGTSTITLTGSANFITNTSDVITVTTAAPTGTAAITATDGTIAGTQTITVAH
jgi:uncharacterized protein YjdB